MSVEQVIDAPTVSDSTRLSDLLASPSLRVAPVPIDSNVLPKLEFEPVEYIPESKLKRFFDFSFSCLGFTLFFPILALMAIMVKLDSNGPFLYSQVRIGANRRKYTPSKDKKALQNKRRYDYGGKPFFVLKFRSMHTDAEANGQAVWSQDNDPRVTRMGRILRKTHLDELPQLFNILVGDMSLVGPRPERPVLIAKLQEAIPGYRQRQSVKPGITGLAQTRHRADMVLDDVRKKIKYDNFYIRKMSLPTDFGILMETVPYAFGFSTKELRRALAGRIVAKCVRGLRKAKVRILL